MGICPKMSRPKVSYDAVGDPVYDDFVDCQGKDCQWFRAGNCVVFGIAVDLEKIAVSLDDINARLELQRRGYK